MRAFSFGGVIRALSLSWSKFRALFLPMVYFRRFLSRCAGGGVGGDLSYFSFGGGIARNRSALCVLIA